MRNLSSEFQDFLRRGDLVDLAVAFVMGIALSEIVKAIVHDVVSPLVALITPAGSLEELFLVLR